MRPVIPSVATPRQRRSVVEGPRPREVVAAVDLASAIGAVGSGDATDIQALAVRLRAMLRGLLRRA